MSAPVFTEKSFWRIKLLAFFWLMIFIHLGNKACGQVTLNEKNAPLTRVIKSIEEQSGYLFIYDESKVKLGRVTVQLKNASIYETLANCFRNAPVNYVIIEKNIVLKPKRETPVVVDSISGKIVDEKGEGLPGATVFLNDSRQTVVSDNDGSNKPSLL